MGDDSLVERLYQRYAPALFAFLCQHTATREDAEDLLVQVFLTALEETVLVDLAEKQQVAWLWRVARNMAINTHRRTARHPVLELEQVAAFGHVANPPGYRPVPVSYQITTVTWSPDSSRVASVATWSSSPPWGTQFGPAWLYVWQVS